MEDYYLFLDESGTSSLKNVDPEFPVLVLTGVLISRKEYETLCAKVCQFKSKYFGDKEVVLHRRDMRKYEKGFEILFDDKVKQRFYIDLNAILKEADYQLISSAIDINAYIRKFGRLADDAYQIALTFILERAIRETDGANVRIQAYIESRGADKDELVANHYNTLLHRGSSYIDSREFLERFCSSLLFRKKRDMEIGIEIADLCAYPIARRVMQPNEANTAFDVILGKIRRGSHGKIIGYGIKLFP